MQRSSIRQENGNRALHRVGLELGTRKYTVEREFASYVWSQPPYSSPDGKRSIPNDVSYRGMLITREALERIQREGLTREQIIYPSGKSPSIAEHWFSNSARQALGYNIYRAPSTFVEDLSGDVLFVVLEMDRKRLPAGTVIEQHIEEPGSFAVIDHVPPEALTRAYIFNPNNTSSNEFRTLNLQGPANP